MDIEKILQGRHGQAIYEQIKEYGLKNQGLKVIQLTIRVKRKYGIIKCENCSQSMNNMTKQLRFSPKNKAIITETLEYFRMI